MLYAAFLGSMESIVFVSQRYAIAFSPTMTAYLLKPESNYRHNLSYSVPAQLHLGGTGILTCFPSASPFGYALGAD